MEIERKFLVKILPNLSDYSFHSIEQGYLNTNPVVRVRKQDDEYYLTYKGSGLMTREEYNLPLTKDGYLHLIDKADDNVITKKSYRIPFEKYIIELDVFEGLFKGIILAEVEFENEAEAKSFVAPDWFGKDVTLDGRFHNSKMSKMNSEDISLLVNMSKSGE